MSTYALSRSAKALAKVLKQGGPAARALKARFHRVQLYGYRVGRRCPDAANIAEIHKLTRGVVPADGWRVALRSYR